MIIDATKTPLSREMDNVTMLQSYERDWRYICMKMSLSANNWSEPIRVSSALVEEDANIFSFMSYE